MGKKRTRVPGQPRTAATTEAAPAQHTDTLEDAVRGQRDVQFALEKRLNERKKRRKLVDDAEDAPSVAAPAERPSDPPGVDVWRRAAARRNKLRAAAAAPQADADADDETRLDAKTGAKIVEQARRQRRELRDEDVMHDAVGTGSAAGATQTGSIEAVLKGLGGTGSASEARLGPRAGAPAGSDDDDDEDDDDEDGNADTRSLAYTEVDAQSAFGDREQDLDFLDGSRITEEEEVALSLFAPRKGVAPGPGDEDEGGYGDNGGKIMLADIIVAKIREKEEADARAAAAAADPERAARDKKIAEVYGLVGNIMSRYRSGRVPKAFKVIPKMRNWEDLLYMTRPDEWTSAGVYVATRVLASNLTAKEVVRFYSDILLPRCLEDIADNKKLNYHLYRALEKAVYKPEAFSKGILFPLCEDRGVTFRQALLIASVVAKVSIPMLHSAAALLHIAQLPFSPTSCLVIKALIEKKYALPYRVVDIVVDSFVAMKDDERPLPVLWHQSLLSFAQRYKSELTAEQKHRLKILMRKHTHPGVTPEIRRELFSVRNRGEAADPDANTIARNIANATAMVDA